MARPFLFVPSSLLSLLPPFVSSSLISDVWPRVRTRVGRGCHPHGLQFSTGQHYRQLPRHAGQTKTKLETVPGPLTFRMIDRVWSSMNSTRTWVTPPREPAPSQSLSRCRPQEGTCPKRDRSKSRRAGSSSRTGSAEDSGDLHKLYGGLGGIHFRCMILFAALAIDRDRERRVCEVMRGEAVVKMHFW